MRILVLTHRFPYPPNKGDRIRTYNVLKYLSANAEVDLATLTHDPSDAAHESALGQLCDRVAAFPIGPRTKWAYALRSFCRGKSLTEGIFHSSGLQSQIRRWARIRQYDAVVAFCSSMQPYLRIAELASVPKYVDFIDVDSQKWRDYAVASSAAKKVLFRIEAQRVTKLEEEILVKSEASLVVSQEEVQLLAGLPGSEKSQAMPNGVDIDYFAPFETTTPAADSPSCVFVGALDYLPNVEGVQWFCENVWHKLLERWPTAKFHIVGRQPAKAIESLQSELSIEVHADVPDVRPYLAGANVVVAPLQIARGIQNKVLEAMAMAKAVVASPEASTGIDAAHGQELLVADSTDEWLEHLTALLPDTERQQRLGAAARSFVETHHDWEACLRPLGELLPATVTTPMEVAHV